MPDINKVKYIIFDWDNTLALTKNAVISSVDFVLKSYSLPGWEISKEKRDKNLSFRDNFCNLFGENLAGIAYEKYQEKYKENSNKLIEKAQYVDDLISFLMKKNITLLIVTNKDRTLFELEYATLFPNTPFKKIVCGNEAGRNKPYPEPAWLALNEFLEKNEITPETVLFVGDSSQDYNCALNINATPILIGESLWEENCTFEKAYLFNDFKSFLENLDFEK